MPILRSLRDMAVQSGLDPSAALYNTAVGLAENGHFGQAQDHLHVLLALWPHDGEAWLLLARVLVAGQQWRRALSALDRATACGQAIPDDLRQAVETHLHADDDARPDSDLLSTRTEGEQRRMSTEIKRLRSDNARLLVENQGLTGEAKRWAMISCVVAGVSIVVMLSGVWKSFRSTDAPPPQAITADVEATLPPAQQPVSPAAAAPTVATTTAAPTAGSTNAATPADAATKDAKLRDQMATALATLSDVDVSKLHIEVNRGDVFIRGSAPKATDLRQVVTLISDLPGVGTVNTEPVTFTVRSVGATHTVVSGDSLRRIAQNHYGDASLYTHIIEANPALGGKPDLKVGQQLKIPALPADLR